MRIFGLALMILTGSVLCAQSGQIAMDRVELMPTLPEPYILRDWKRVAQRYDSLVYDASLTGEHLPLVFTRDEGVNYPENESFGLHTYVGTFSPGNGEGINVLPSLVSATLAGIDKRNQFGKNWIRMSQDYFNHANGENLYLNNIGGHSGNDWWYDMLPNIYFYQLYDLYGNEGHAAEQFVAIADRMLEAVKAMGGSVTPWNRASMNYRAWDFINMQPNTNGVIEPEAAGAFAWLLYQAYVHTGDIRYLQGAEWSMEFLINLNTNPSYELQLPYGAYAAARMNAEIGTEYNIEKLLFWIFNRGPLRGWGTIVGEWNQFDVSGLVGEANDGGNDYAFQLNGVQQAGALVPLARYDERFARTIARWMLNVTNATRLMYPGFLPSHLQDAHSWSSVYDPHGVMGYEALREIWNGQSPFATGDALQGGWAATNLSLYSTSSIGYLGAVVEATDVDRILKLDLLATDFFHEAAYPSYLLYNPYADQRIITLNVGTEAVDIYDALTESFLALNVSGNIQITIPGDYVFSIVLAPANGVMRLENNKRYIDDVVVDYHQTEQLYNYPPRIQSFATPSLQVEKNQTITLFAKGLDQETKDLTYTFQLPDDTISGLAKETEWLTPDTEGAYTITLIATDEGSLSDTATLIVEVVEEVNIAPVIASLSASSRYTNPGGVIELHAVVSDANHDVLQYTWTADGGNTDGNANTATWHAPVNEGIYTIRLDVHDGRGGSASQTIRLLVTDLSSLPTGNIIAWYPFTGNAQDISGYQHHGSVQGAKLTEDSLGQAQSAYFFDGVNDHIRVTNTPDLNCTAAITVMAFVTPNTIGDKERFILSHGSWQQRWKISITPEGHFRWTLKNASGTVRDLDSETMIEEDKLYHVACAYDGQFLLLYINGRLENFSMLSGEIAASSVDLEMGQILPDDAQYNFHGDLDEVKIYDYALHPDSVATESGQIINSDHAISSDPLRLLVFPQPADDVLSVHIQGHTPEIVSMQYALINAPGQIVLAGIESVSGRLTLDISSLNAGYYQLQIQTREGFAVVPVIIQ